MLKIFSNFSCPFLSFFSVASNVHFRLLRVSWPSTSRKQINPLIPGEPLPTPGDPALWDPAWKSGPGEEEEEGGAVARQGGQGGQGGGGQVWQGDTWTPLPGGD